MIPYTRTSDLPARAPDHKNSVIYTENGLIVEESNAQKRPRHLPQNVYTSLKRSKTFNYGDSISKPRKVSNNSIYSYDDYQPSNNVRKVFQNSEYSPLRSESDDLFDVLNIKDMSITMPNDFTDLKNSEYRSGVRHKQYQYTSFQPNLRKSIDGGASNSYTTNVTRVNVRDHPVQLGLSVRKKEVPRINIIRASCDLSARALETDLPLAQHDFLPPLNSSDALSLVGKYLTRYEMREIKLGFDIYFAGINATKIHGMIDSSLKNFGYDDEHDNYIPVLNDHILYRYQVMAVIGKGSFCQMIQAFDHKRKRLVAIKIIRNTETFRLLVKEEMNILEHLRRFDVSNASNIVHMQGYFRFRNHACITFELLDLSLYEYLKKNKFRGFEMIHVEKFATELLKCLCVLENLRIIHCDLKPENILFVSVRDHTIKVIIDFYLFYIFVNIFKFH